MPRNAHFLRSGESGDWVHYFTRSAEEGFERYTQGTLEYLGYEKDSSWIERCEAE